MNPPCEKLLVGAQDHVRHGFASRHLHKVKGGQQAQLGLNPRELFAWPNYGLRPDDVSDVMPQGWVAVQPVSVSSASLDRLLKDIIGAGTHRLT